MNFEKRFLISNSVASGGFGEVFKAQDLESHQPVAIKNSTHTDHRIFR